MSQDYAAVLVWRRGECDARQVLHVLAPVLDVDAAGAAEKVAHAALRTALGGRWRWVDLAPAHCAAATWHIAANALHCDEAAAMDRVDRYLGTALATLAPAFGWFGLLKPNADREALERVCAQLVRGDWPALLAPAHARLVLPAAQRDAWQDHPGWRVLADEDAGALVQVGRL